MTWMARWRPPLRLAARDAARHWVRSVLAVVLVSLPVAWLVSDTSLSGSMPTNGDVVLARIPEGAQAVLTATTADRHGPPMTQTPEGSTTGEWSGDGEPAGADELARLLPPENQLVQFWAYGQLLATTGTDLAPGEESSAGEHLVEDIDVAQLSTVVLLEAQAQGLPVLMPAVDVGSVPTDATQVVITSKLAGLLGLSVGDQMTFVAPHQVFGAGEFTDLALGEAVQDTQRGYRVVGVAEGDLPQAWALEGWLAAAAAAHPEGNAGNWLVVGEQPVTWDQTKALNRLYTVVISRHVLTHYPAKSELYPVEEKRGDVLADAVKAVTAAGLGALLVLFLITPAFTVSVDQSRRMLGMAAAAGASPRDLRRMLTAQGLVVGLVGGLLGSVLGVLVAVVTPLSSVLDTSGTPQIPDGAEGLVDLSVRFSWWTFVAAVGVGLLIGFVATAAAAWTASRLHPVDALKDRRAPRVRRAVLDSVFLGPAVLGAGVATAVLALTVVSSSSVSRLVGLLVAALVLVVTGLALVVRSVPALAARVVTRLPAGPRLALRDAADHPSRFVPAALAVLVTVCVASCLTVAVGSAVANDRILTGDVVGPGGLTLSVRQPISEGFDRLVLRDAVDTLAAELPVVGHESVYAVDEFSLFSEYPEDGGFIEPVRPQDLCPEGKIPSVGSTSRAGLPLRCEDGDPDQVGGGFLEQPWWLDGDFLVMGGDTMRASGLPGADKAAQTLDAGGVVVNDASLVSRRGTVQVAASQQVWGEAERGVELPGAFVHGLSPKYVVSPETARSFGVPLTYLGEYVVTDSGLSASQIARARDIIDEHTSLVVVGESQYQYPWGEHKRLIPVAVLVVLALVATTISLALAKTQVRRDMVTMHAVGASGSFLRRFVLTQAVVILAAGVPLGLACGLGLGAYQVTWLHEAALQEPEAVGWGVHGVRYYGPQNWLETVMLWPVQVTIVVSVVAVGLATALTVARPARRLVQRGID
ncbi:MAG: FtsX-like permease family protein [Micrococcales bacterium]|nr:FtsX-like permease family protein [Micrococcales bacterium]MCL2666624.1 FtsX-like permease family protein [Micrococcales bacterium]